MKILIVKLSSLGDVVHAMPAVQDLRQAWPQAQIDWVVEPAFAPLLRSRRLAVWELQPHAQELQRVCPLQLLAEGEGAAAGRGRAGRGALARPLRRPGACRAAPPLTGGARAGTWPTRCS